jgi:hypothetical protein
MFEKHSFFVSTIPVSPNSPTMSGLASDPYLPVMLVLRLQNHRLSKKLGVLNEDVVYS